MSEDRNADEARQGEFGRRTFIVLIISTTIAALFAIFAYMYVFSSDNETLDSGLPTTGVTQTPPDGRE
ncbi:hypothetical protein [Acuticoccus sp.]|uniref:hypothetical protein n=1 Tax=Acuticoccus sp. TaxID=1904378 RepID=UPI003B5218A9